MNRLFIAILLVLMTTYPAVGAILVLNPNGGLPVVKSTLSAAASDADTAGKTVLITTALSAVQSNISSATVHTWPSDRTITFQRGGSIANTTIFRYGGSTVGWTSDEKFSGAGRVEFTAPVTNPHGWFSSGKPVIINSKLDAQPILISSALTFGSSATMINSYPEWWGVDGTADEVETQKAIDAPSETAWLTASVYNWAAQVYMKASGKKLKGGNQGTVRVNSTNTSGTAIAGASSLSTVISYCEISGFYLYGAADTGPAVGLDISTFTNSVFDLQIQLLATNAVDLYGIGNGLGSAPYYNHIMGEYYGNASSKTQTGIKFVMGTGGFSAAGPNANIIGPIKHMQSLKYGVDLVEGNGNLFHNINLENIADYHIRLNNAISFTDTGTSSGSNGQVTLKDTGKSWTTNAYVGYGVAITGGTGAGQVRIVASNTGTQLTVQVPWALIPDGTSTYTITKSGATENQFSSIRAEGASVDNPDFIYALPGATGNKFTNIMAGSLGSGVYVRDESGATDNIWYDGGRACFTETVSNPGASTTVTVYPRTLVYGGVQLSKYVVEWLSVAVNESAPGGTITARLDSGGTAPATGSDMTLTAVTTAATDSAFAMPAATEKIVRDGTNRHMFLSVETGSGVSATADIVLTWCATIL